VWAQRAAEGRGNSPLLPHCCRRPYFELIENTAFTDDAA
jgi:hypothetical protein